MNPLDLFYLEIFGIISGMAVLGIVLFKLWSKAFKSWNESGDGERPVNGSVEQ